jgi:Amt family ammonium transporter
VLMAQAVGSIIITLSTFVVAFALMSAVNAMGILRVSQEGEQAGLDLHEHGISAYPEYVISARSTPAAMTIASEGMKHAAEIRPAAGLGQQAAH